MATQRQQRELDGHRKSFQSSLKQRELEFYEDHDDCPTCKQGIPHDHKERVKEGKSQEIQDLTRATKGLDKKYEEVADTLEKFVDLSNRYPRLQTEMISQERYQKHFTE